MKRILYLLPALLALPAPQATPIKNPSALAFTCPDHAADTAHEIAIVRDSDGVTIQTISGGDPALTGNEVVIPLNVQPIEFGRYKFRARAGGPSPSGTIWSDWSDLTEVWERAPGKPGGLAVK